MYLALRQLHIYVECFKAAQQASKNGEVEPSIVETLEANINRLRVIFDSPKHFRNVSS